MTSTEGGCPPPAFAHRLTEGELEVLRHIAAGRPNKTIANRVGLATSGVDRRVSRIFAKLQATDRAHAVHIGHRAGLLR